MNPSFSLRRLLALSLSALCLALPGTAALAQTAPVKIKFALDWRFEGPSSLFLLPLAKGYFAQEGLDVTIDAGGGSGATVNRLASGAYDMGFADMGAMIEFIANNQDTTSRKMQAVYLVYEQAPITVFSLKKSNITKPSDLEGKTMGAPVFDPGRKLFSLFTQANKLDSAKMPWKTMDPALRETMLIKGEVDAITGFYFTSLMNLNARGIKDDEVAAMQFVDYGVKMYGNAIIASQALIDANPKAVAGFLRAFTRGAKEVIADPDAAIKFVKDREPLIDVEVEKRRLRLALQVSIATPAAKTNGIGVAEKGNVDRMVREIVSAFGLKQSPNPDLMFNAGFMPPKPERMIFTK
jgi:NitT/TauT family transport system substrate-binding protein